MIIERIISRIPRVFSEHLTVQHRVDLLFHQDRGEFHHDIDPTIFLSTTMKSQTENK
jgi:hypothetical protein